MNEQLTPPVGVGPLVFITTTIGECIVPRAWPMQAVFTMNFLKSKMPLVTLTENNIKIEVNNGSATYTYEDAISLPGSKEAMVIAKLLTPTAVFNEPVTREAE